MAATRRSLAAPASFHNVCAHRAGKRREKSALGSTCRPSGRSEFGIVEKALGSRVKAIVEIGVDPFEIEHQPQRLADPDIVENRRGARLKTKPSMPFGPPIGRLARHDPMIASGRKIIAGRQRAGFVSIAEVDEPGLEGFELALASR